MGVLVCLYEWILCVFVSCLYVKLHRVKGRARARFAQIAIAQMSTRLKGMLALWAIHIRTCATS